MTSYPVFDNIDWEGFKIKLDVTRWSETCNDNYVNNRLTNFINSIVRSLEENGFFYRKVTANSNKNIKKWWNPQLTYLWKNRNEAYHSFNMNRNGSTKLCYKSAQNTFHTSVRESKRNMVKNCASTRSLWKLISG